MGRLGIAIARRLDCVCNLLRCGYCIAGGRQRFPVSQFIDERNSDDCIDVLAVVFDRRNLFVFENMKPRRTQRSRQRTPGIPVGSVYVGRPSQWGNPAAIGSFHSGELIRTNYDAVTAFYWHLYDIAKNDPVGFRLLLLPLIGRDLCCWCSPDAPCHADILIALTEHLRPILEIVDDGTLIRESIPNWPQIRDIIVL